MHTSKNYTPNHFVDKVCGTLLRGGRVTKLHGQIMSIAPSIGAAALGVVMVTVSAEQARAGACGSEVPGADTITCTTASIGAPFGNGITYASDGLTLILDDPALTTNIFGVTVRGASTSTLDISVIGTSFDTITTTLNSRNGIAATTRGTGNTLAQMDGGTITTSGDFLTGLFSYNFGNPNSVGSATALLNAGDVVTAGEYTTGVKARTYSLGAALAQMNGGSVTTSGAFSSGLVATIHNGNSAATATALMTAGDIVTTGTGAHGVVSVTLGTGLATATVSGASTVTASGLDSDGIATKNWATAATYAVAVNDTAVVTGGSGTGTAIRTQSFYGSNGTINIASGATVDGSTYGTQAIVDTAGNVTANVAGTVSGTIMLGYGSDTLNIASAANITGVTLLDGGDDTSNADTFVDHLTLAGQALSITGASLINWENLTVDGGSLAITDGALTVGANAGTGLVITNAAILNAAGALALTGNLTTAAGGTFDGTGGGTGVYSVSGSVLNNGVITTQDGAVGDVITVAGDYAGSGTLLMDIDTATGGVDMFTIAGNVTGGSTVITLNNLSPLDGTATDITVVTVGGTSAATDFTLAGGALTAGAFDYGLAQVGNSFVLAGAVNSTGATYEAAPSVLGAFNRLPTLEQRVSERQQLADQAVWVRVHGDHLNASNTSQSDVESNTWGMQAGIDFDLDPNENGRWVLGVTTQYGTSAATVTSALGFGNIDTDGFGVGATATWYGNSGTYVDAQAQMSWLNSDFSSSASGVLASGELSEAYALSIEVGHRFALSSGNGMLVPQAQLTFGTVAGAAFNDTAGNVVDLGSNSSTIGRLGLAYEFGNDADGNNFHIIANLLQDFSSDSTVNISGTGLSTGAVSSTWGEIGIGGSYSVSENKTFYGEASYRTSLSGNAADNHGLSLTAGLRIQW